MKFKLRIIFRRDGVTDLVVNSTEQSRSENRQQNVAQKDVQLSHMSTSLQQMIVSVVCGDSFAEDKVTTPHGFRTTFLNLFICRLHMVPCRLDPQECLMGTAMVRVRLHCGVTVSSLCLDCGCSVMDAEQCPGFGI